MYTFPQVFKFEECAESIKRHLVEDFHCNVCLIMEEKEDSDPLNRGNPHLARYHVS